MTKVNYISVAKKSAAIQIKELKKINKVFNKNFVKAVDIIHKAKGKVVCSGVGKSGLIARKVSASLSSVGISSFFLDPNSAIHGDLGQIDKRDVLIVFSYSGNTSELTNLLKYSNRFGIKVIGVASGENSLLIKASDVPVILPKVKEADPIGMVPSSSTSITLLFGDSLMSGYGLDEEFHLSTILEKSLKLKEFNVKVINAREQSLLKQLFSNRLIVIDEVQNIRTNKGKEDMDSIDADEKVFQILILLF